MLRFLSTKVCAFVISICILSSIPAKAAGQSMEERFQDLFVTAGYCTAFGAALGTAFLALQENPAEHLQYVAVGASLGFIGGSILGSYIIFSPLVTDEHTAPGGSLASEGLLPDHHLVVRPTFDRETHTLKSVEGGLALARF